MTQSHKPGTNRKRLLRILAALPFARGLFGGWAAAAATAPFSRVRPGDPQWPSDEALRQKNVCKEKSLE